MIGIRNNLHLMVVVCILAVFALSAGNVASATDGSDQTPESLLSMGRQLADAGPQSTPKVDAAAVVAGVDDSPAPPAGDGPPLPLHTIEGVGGALTVPMAYLVNPGPKGTIIGRPAVSASFLSLGDKNLTSLAITETLFGRIELGYAINRFGLGNLGKAIEKESGGALRIRRHEVYLHHFNIRGLVVEENSCGLPLPAVVVGAQFKVNGGIEGMDESTNGALSSIGYDKRNGVDFVITMSKMFPKLLFGRPLILTLGVRNSKASNIGYTGFSKKCQTTIETDVATLITDRIAVGYEFRQKNNPYDVAPGILNDEDDWHAIRAAYIVNDQFTVAAAWGYLGPVGNHFANCAWGVQLKYEF